MKKLFLILTILTTVVMTAQDVKETSKSKSFIKDLSNEQIATLKTKQMTLAYNLSEKQVDAIYTIQLELVNKRKSKTKISAKDRKQMSSDEKYQLLLSRLDAKIDTKKRFAVVLTEKQMEKFELQSKYKGKYKKARKRNLKKKGRRS